MVHQSKILSLAILLASSPSFSGTMGTTSGWSPVVSLGIGPGWSDAGKTQTFFLQPEVQKTYEATHNTHVFAQGEVFLGGQHPLIWQQNHWTGQLGFVVAAATSTWVNGNIWEDADPDFDNYWYGYQINHVRVGAQGKIAWENQFWLHPYVSGSLGLGINRSHGFTITPKIPEEVPAPSFRGYTETAFAYSVGVGLQTAVMNHMQLGAGYEFADWGRSQLARAPGQTLNEGLYLNHTFTNGLQLTLSYIA